MATRSSITAKLSDGTYRSVYCHWDGYLSNNGKILLGHYNSQQRAEEITSLGAISTLAESTEKPAGHTFDTRVEGYTVFFHRDRGEEWSDCAPTLGTRPEDCIDWQEYNYLWDGEQWLVHFWGCEGGKFMPLVVALARDAMSGFDEE